MGDPLMTSSKIAVAGMKAQAERQRIVSENMANVDSLPQTPDGLPYRRKTITFRDELDKQTGAHMVKVAAVGVDPSPLQKRYDPTHPAADVAGYVLAPNVNPLIEMLDMQEAQQSYVADENALSVSHAMMGRLMDMLKDK